MENYESFRRLENISGLRVIAGNKDNFDLNVIKKADFLFIYKNAYSIPLFGAPAMVHQLHHAVIFKNIQIMSFWKTGWPMYCIATYIANKNTYNADSI